jgi:hypothetical protein
MWSRISPYIWDGYEAGEVPSNLKLWSKIWQNLWENDRNHYYHRFEAISLRIVLKQVVDDVCLSMLKDKSIIGIKEQLNHKLKYAKSLDPIATNMLSIELGHLSKLINGATKDQSHFEEIIQLCKYLPDRLSDERYFEQLFSKLKELIFNNQNPKILELKNISQLLITELVEKGFTLYTIAEIPDNLFNKSRITYHKSLPLFKGKYWGTNIDFDIEEDTPLISRFEFFKRIYTAPKFQASAMFLILGAASRQGERIKIGEIEFHPPLEIEGNEEEGKSLWVFMSLEKEEQNKPFLRASIMGEGVDCFKILEDARTEIQKATDFLKFRYSSKMSPGKVKVSRSWALLDTVGNPIYQMPNLWEGLPEYKPYYEGIDLVTRHKDAVEFVERQGKKYGLEYGVLSSNKIYQALHWVHKAQEAKHIEDYFMSWWIALEYLVRKEREKIIDSILSLVPPICLNDFFDDLQGNLRNLLLSQVMNGFLTVEDEELASKYGLVRRPIEFTWSVKDFCKDLPEIMKYVKDRYVHERAKEILILSEDKKELLELLNKLKEKLEYELLTIYRIRNKIVHSAEYDHEYIIHYAIRLREIVDAILHNVMFYLQYFPERSIEEILTRSKVINELYFTKLENDPDFDIHNFRFFT